MSDDVSVIYNIQIYDSFGIHRTGETTNSNSFKARGKHLIPYPLKLRHPFLPHIIQWDVIWAKLNDGEEHIFAPLCKAQLSESTLDRFWDGREDLATAHVANRNGS